MLKIKQIWRTGLGLALVLMSVACSQPEAELVPAPLGDRAVLEKLADAYTAVSDQRLGVSPMSLPGDERHKFVVEVFSRAGYDYSGTLRMLAMGDFDRNNQLHKDMVELLLMPHRNQKMAKMPAAKIYTGEELMDVATLERLLNQ